MPQRLAEQRWHDAWMDLELCMWMEKKHACVCLLCCLVITDFLPNVCSVLSYVRWSVVAGSCLCMSFACIYIYIEREIRY